MSGCKLVCLRSKHWGFQACSLACCRALGYRQWTLLQITAMRGLNVVFNPSTVHQELFTCAGCTAEPLVLLRVSHAAACNPLPEDWEPPPLPSQRTSHCLHQEAAAALKRVCIYPGFISAHGSLAATAWLYPQAPGCLPARLPEDLSDNPGLQPHKGYSCCEKGWWRGCTGRTLLLSILCQSSFCLAVLNAFKQAHGRAFCSLGDREAGRVANLPGWPLAVHQISPEISV